MRKLKVELTQDQARYLLDVLIVDLENLNEFKRISRGSTNNERKEIKFVQRLFGNINQALGEAEKDNA